MFTFSVTEEYLSSEILCAWKRSQHICGVPLSNETKRMVNSVLREEGVGSEEDYVVSFTHLLLHQGYLYPSAPPKFDTPLLLQVEIPPGDGGKLVFTTRINGVNVPLIGNTRVKLVASFNNDGMYSYLFMLLTSSILQIERTGVLPVNEYRNIGIKWRGKDSPLGPVSYRRWNATTEHTYSHQ